MRKRFMAILLTIAMVVTLMPISALADTVKPIASESKSFKDMPTDWSKAALEKAVENGLLTGTDGLILAKESLTRAQMAAVLARAFGAASLGDVSKFTDVKPTDWFYMDMQKAVTMKTFMGEGNKMNPNTAITREEAFVVLSRALQLTDEKPDLTKFADAHKVSAWAISDVSALVKAGYVSGNEGMLNPKANITRAEFAVLMDSVFKTYINKAGTYTDLVEGNVIVSVPDVVIKDTTVKGDLIVGDGVGNGTFILDNVKVLGRTVVRGGGVNSFIVRNGSSLDNVIISKTSDGEIRVDVSDDSNIEVIFIDDGKDDVLMEGSFGDVQIDSDTPVIFKDADVKNIVTTAANANVTVGEGSKVDTFATLAANTTLNIDGTVTNVAATAEATGASFNVGKTGTATNVITAAPSTTLTNDGKVGTMAVSKDAKDAKIVVGKDSTLTSVVNETKGNLTVTTAAAEQAAKEQAAAKAAAEKAEAEKLAAEKALAEAKTAEEKAIAEAAAKAAAEAAAKAEAEKKAADKSATEAKAEAEKAAGEVSKKTEEKPVEPPKVNDKGEISVPSAPETTTPPPTTSGGGGNNNPGGSGDDDTSYPSTAWVRPDGAAGNTTNYKYAEAYSAIGVTVSTGTTGNGGVTINANAATLAEANVPAEVINRNTFYVGIQFATPSNAKGVKYKVNDGSFSANGIDLTTDGDNAFGGKFMEYFGVATSEKGAVKIRQDAQYTVVANWYTDAACTPETAAGTSTYTVRYNVNNEVLETGKEKGDFVYGSIADLGTLTTGAEVTLVKDATVSETLTIPAGVTLTIPAGVTLTIPTGVTLTILAGATLTLAEGATLTLAEGATLINNNTID